LSVKGESDITVTVSNVGSRPGKCVIQFYLERVSLSKVTRPSRWLVGFEAIRAPAEDSVLVETSIPLRRFAHWGEEGWDVEPGVFRLIAGLSVTDTDLFTTIVVPEPATLPRA
jgi:beta-glucosidase